VPRIEYQDFEDEQSVYEYSYPSDLELINIFPESKELIPLKIKEWRREKRKIVKTETIPYLTKCNLLSDEFSKAFWKEVYSYIAGAFNYIVAQVTRLERLKAIIDNPEGYTNSTARIILAKQTPITNIYNFIRRNRSYLCPIHNDKDPSLHIYKDNTWHCFGCNKGGDTIDFVKYMFGYSFHQAINYILAGNAGPKTSKETV
jgi:hypothetical protein